jgi:hypothetical protein
VKGYEVDVMFGNGMTTYNLCGNNVLLLALVKVSNTFDTEVI